MTGIDLLPRKRCHLGGFAAAELSQQHHTARL